LVEVRIESLTGSSGISGADGAGELDAAPPPEGEDEGALEALGEAPGLEEGVASPLHAARMENKSVSARSTARCFFIIMSFPVLFYNYGAALLRRIGITFCINP